MEDCKFTTSLNREISNLKELVITRIDGMDKAIEKSHANYVRVPTDIQKEIKALKDFLLAKIEGEHQLKEVKFAKVEQRFELIEKARLEQKEDTRVAVDAALKAQEMAFVKQNESFILSINKSEAATTKQMDGLDSKITDLKDRLTRIEGQSTGRKDFWGYIVGAIGIALAIAGYLKHW